MVVRRLWVDAETGSYACEALNFPGSRAVLRVDCTTAPPGGVATAEVRYFVTSLDPARVPARRLLELVRRHWQVENGLHYVKDRWWDEDRHVCRRPGLAAGFTTLVTAALTVLRATHPGGVDGPLRAHADDLNRDVHAAIGVMAGRTL